MKVSAPSRTVTAIVFTGSATKTAPETVLAWNGYVATIRCVTMCIFPAAAAPSLMTASSERELRVPKLRWQILGEAKDVQALELMHDDGIVDGLRLEVALQHLHCLM
jgi:hypothetical protein